METFTKGSNTISFCLLRDELPGRCLFGRMWQEAEFSQDAVVTARVELVAEVRGDGEKRRGSRAISGWKVQDRVPHQTCEMRW